MVKEGANKLYIFNGGVIKIGNKPAIARIFCKHEYIEGEICSSSGMTRIGGADKVVVCKKCGKISKSYSYDY